MPSYIDITFSIAQSIKHLLKQQQQQQQINDIFLPLYCFNFSCFWAKMFVQNTKKHTLLIQWILHNRITSILLSGSF